MEQWTDEELIERCQAVAGPAAGEPFLNVLFQRHHGRVASWCYHMTGDTNSAVDLAQEIFGEDRSLPPGFIRSPGTIVWTNSGPGKDKSRR